MAIFTGKTTPPDAQDLFLGADDVADVFRFTPATLEAADTVVGGGGAVIDILQFIAAGTIEAGRFDGVSGIERVQSHAGGNSYALTQALVAGAFGTFEARGLAGDDRIDASAVLDPTLGISFISGGGADTLTGGAGADRFNALVASAGARILSGGAGNDTVTTAPAYWTAADVFEGGSGTDRITFAEAGHVTADQLAGLSGVEEIQFFSNVTLSVTLTDALVAQAGGLLTVIGGAGSGQAVDASAVLNGRVHYLAGTGADTFLGSAGDDVFAVQEAGSTGHLGDGDDILHLDNRKASGIVVDGGAGYDTAVLAAGGPWDLTGLTGFEQLELAGAGTALLPDQPGLRVLGSEQRDIVTLGAPGQTVFGFGGDDIVLVTAANLVGAVLHGGSQATSDILRMVGAGTYDFRRVAITGFERFETTAAPVAAGPSTIVLPNTPLDLLLRHAAAVTLGSNPAQTAVGSVRADSFTLGAAGQFVEGGGGDDTFIGTAATLGAGTILAGGPGLDLLLVQGGGSVDLATGALAVGIERVTLGSATALILDTMPGIEVTGSTGADTVTANGAGVFGTLGSGNDLLRVNLTQLAVPGAETMSGGTGNDTLAVVDDSALFFQTVLPERFIGFERIDLSGLLGAQVTLEGAEGRHVLLGASNISVFGGPGADYFDSAGPIGLISGGDGNDTIRQTVAPGAGQVLVGMGGDDEIIYDRGTASQTTTMPTTWAAETVRLLGAHTFTANTSAGIAFIGDPTLANSITLRGNNQSVQGGSGADTLTATSGLGTTLAGGEGADMYLIHTNDQALWNTAGRAIVDTVTGLNDIRINGTGSLVIDFHDHTVLHIDRILIFSPNATVDLTLTAEMAATADGSNSGSTGNFFVQPWSGSMNVGVRIDASDFEAGQVLRLVGIFNGADTVIGGEGADTIPGGNGADLLIGNGGPDSLTGGDGTDTIFAGNGADTIIGGLGGDVIDVAEDALNESPDLIRYTSINDGSVDINDNTSVNQNTADSVGGFDAATDTIQLSRAGLGLGNGGVTAVPANGFWNIGGSAVFLFESDSANSDTLNSNNFASFSAISFAINFDNGLGGGSSPGRTVALLISNPETEAVRATGLYVWTDVDGDNILEVADIVRLLGVFHGVTANQLAAGGSIDIII